MNKLYNYLIKDGDAIAVGISVLCMIIFAIGIFMGFSSAGYDMSTDLTELEDKSKVNFFNSGLWIMIYLTIISIAAMILGIIWDLVKNFKSGFKTIIGILGIIVAFVVLYLTSSYDSGGRFEAYWSKEPFFITQGLSKFISAGLYSMMGLTAVAFLCIIVFEVRNFFK